MYSAIFVTVLRAGTKEEHTTQTKTECPKMKKKSEGMGGDLSIIKVLCAADVQEFRLNTHTHSAVPNVSSFR